MQNIISQIIFRDLFYKTIGKIKEKKKKLLFTMILFYRISTWTVFKNLKHIF